MVNLGNMESMSKKFATLRVFEVAFLCHKKLVVSPNRLALPMLSLF
jgi:hypothetical protein